MNLQGKHHQMISHVLTVNRDSFLFVSMESEAKEAFDSIADNGLITIGILGKMFRSLGNNLKDSEINKFISEHGDGRQGSLDLASFTKQYKEPPSKEEEEAEIEEAFKIFDSSHDNFLDVSELKAIFAVLEYDIKETDILTMIKEAKTAKQNLVVV